ncbi:biotin--[acetyl-CoA-carboxylase] ligase [Aggregatilinea lenta]|uniref:biotin--[acetyl-CoA-carboxylase] ligase n=1 Tax=Aggregatilinea lenta TaxID=913108 RepID=UPI0013C360B4|nr:biotin--[acetyl-CoA-carboxylase] ligase [Aggregatilinea lenta]
MSDRFTSDSLRMALGHRPFRFYEVTTSTQDKARAWAVDDPQLPGGAVVIAEEQQKGRGRQGRQWLSPPESSIMCSIVLQPHIVPEQLPRVTMVGAVAVAETLGTILPDEVALKWPNDVLVHGRKICGILAEATWLGNRLNAVILGIGLNVRTDFTGTDLETVATSVEQELGRAVDRHLILANLLHHVDSWVRRIEQPALFDTWQRQLNTLGKRVTVFPQQEEGQPYEGVAESVDENGALMVRLESGTLRRVLAADVGLREGSAGNRE